MRIKIIVGGALIGAVYAMAALAGVPYGKSTVAGLAYAEEPFVPQVTLQELGQQCANSIGRYHVELQVAAIQATKYQAEITRLKAEAAKAKEPEKK